VGPSGWHGVIFDLIRKLKKSGDKYLEMLGDGNQTKSYMYIDDCVNALAVGLYHFSSGIENI
jgi:UDP-glucose 4-epimerase